MVLKVACQEARAYSIAHPIEKRSEMGHYWSEMGDHTPPNEAELSAARGARALRDRGYSDPLEELGMTGHVIRPRYSPLDRDLSLRLHRPCGQAVFDPETHDRYCPAAVSVEESFALSEVLDPPSERDRRATR